MMQAPLMRITLHNLQRSFLYPTSVNSQQAAGHWLVLVKNCFKLLGEEPLHADLLLFAAVKVKTEGRWHS